jgi:hypothetical protein
MDEKKIYELLSAPFHEEAIQRAKKEMTKKGYDTTGVGYQFCVNRLNDVLGIAGWSFPFPEILNYRQGTFKNSGTPFHEITVRADIKIHFGEINAERSCVGGHLAASYADALKGSITNAFKKTVALFGVGRQAYEGTLDDDTEQPDKSENATPADNRFAASPPVRAGSPQPAPGVADAAPRGNALPPGARVGAGVAPLSGGSPPAQPMDPALVADHNKRMEILEIAQNINQSNGESIESLVRKFSEFTGNDGAPVFREDVAALKGKWLNATLGRAREIWNTYSQMTMPQPAPAEREPGADEGEDPF